MKKYIQLKDTWRTKAGDEWIQLNEDTTLYLHYWTQTLEKEKVIKAHPEWFQEVTEPKPSFKKWRAENGGQYFFINEDGTPQMAIDDYEDWDNYRHLTDNYFQELAKCEHRKCVKEAIGRVTHAIVEANEGWEPDWEDSEKKHSYLYKNIGSADIRMSYFSNGYFPYVLPPIRNYQVGYSIISYHKEDLDLIFNVKK